MKTMICPACDSHHFEPARIEGDLAAERCTDCSGVWVGLDRYRQWRASKPVLAANDYAGEISPVNDTVRVCATTQRLMARIRVCNVVPLRLDYSAAGQAVWLDKGEWETLLAMGLHDQLDAIISERWQADLAAAASRDRLEKAMRLRFGDEAYGELARMRAWLAEQPNRSEMIAFLGASD